MLKLWKYLPCKQNLLLHSIQSNNLLSMRKFLLTLFLSLTSVVLLAQESISGRIIDGETEEALIGATVIVKGTSNGTITDINGDFKLSGVSPDAIIQISYVGYETLETNSGDDLSEVKLNFSSVGLKEIQVIASVAIDRETPVAISTISSKKIEEVAGNQEFPELLKSTPGVYATKQGGGFGDSRISIRGFDSDNIGVLINGIPVNDMENGIVYWSNWAGIADVSGSVQVQRGLGASKVAIPSIGGTVNVISRASDRQKGGSAYIGFGNDGYQKQHITLSSGLMENGWAVTAALGQNKRRRVRRWYRIRSLFLLFEHCKKNKR